MPENADSDDWNWFTSLRSNIEHSVQGVRDNILKSNKKIVCHILPSFFSTETHHTIGDNNW